MVIKFSLMTDIHSYEELEKRYLIDQQCMDAHFLRKHLGLPFIDSDYLFRTGVRWASRASRIQPIDFRQIWISGH